MAILVDMKSCLIVGNNILCRFLTHKTFVKSGLPSDSPCVDHMQEGPPRVSWGGGRGSPLSSPRRSFSGGVQTTGLRALQALESESDCQSQPGCQGSQTAWARRQASPAIVRGCHGEEDRSSGSRLWFQLQGQLGQETGGKLEKCTPCLPSQGQEERSRVSLTAWRSVVADGVEKPVGGLLSSALSNRPALAL